MSTQTKSTALPYVFDASGIEPQRPIEAFPGGWYKAEIVDGEHITYEGTTNLRADLVFEILDGPYKGRKVFDGFNYQHSNPQAQEIAQRQLSAISHAIQVLQWQDVQQLFRRPFDLQVGLNPGRWVDAGNKEVPITQGLPAGTPPPGAVKWYDPQNRFKGARALGESAASAPGSSGPAPAWAKPNNAPAPAPAPAAAAPGGAPPWAAAKPAPAAAAPAPANAAPAKPAAPPAPAKPAPAAAPREFHVFMPDGTVTPPKPETEVAAMLAGGMPPETLINPKGGGDGDWKPASSFGIGAAPAAAAPAPANAAPGAPPWARKA